MISNIRNIITVIKFEAVLNFWYIMIFTFPLLFADQMAQWLGKPAAVPEVPGSNPG